MTACSDQPAESDFIVFRGICDGSAAVRLPDRLLMVGYDEVNAFFYFNQHGGAYLHSHSFGAQLNLVDNGEVDIEAAVATDSGIWWIGSHGLDGSGQVAPNRRVLFRTTTPQRASDSIAVNVQPVNLLRRLDGHSLLKDLLSRETLSRKAKKGGINIEGMSIGRDGSLLIGLRSPLSAGMTGDAQVLEFAVQDSRLDDIKLHTLDLLDRGIRDMIPYKNGQLLIAGGVGGDKLFALYYWQSGMPVVHLTALPAALNPESIVRTDAGWLILSDDGKVQRVDSSADDGRRKCDSIQKRQVDHPEVYFRGWQISDAQVNQWLRPQ